MNHLWFVAKLFFDWVPCPLPTNIQRDGEFLLIVPKVRPEVIYLNGPGEFIYSQCDGQKSIQSIVQEYMVEYLRGDRGTAAYEVVRVLRELDSRCALLLMPPVEMVCES